MRPRPAINLGGEPNRVAACRYILSERIRLGRLEVSDPHQDPRAATFTAGPDLARDDTGLLRRIGHGDEDAMAAFYHAHGRVVFAQALLVVGQRVLAEEITQDTMLAVWRGAGSFRGESSVRSWVIAIARRQTRDRLRRRRLRLVDDDFLADQPSSGPGPEAMALDRAELAEVRDAIRDLAPAHREVLGLAFGSGLSLPEVAGVLEIPVGTVKSRLTAARTALNRMLERNGQNR
jgi:RNA polymerase sigma-70 factor, ECF subfamily